MLASCWCGRVSSVHALPDARHDVAQLHAHELLVIRPHYHVVHAPEIEEARKHDTWEKKMKKEVFKHTRCEAGFAPSTWNVGHGNHGRVCTQPLERRVPGATHISNHDMWPFRPQLVFEGGVCVVCVCARARVCVW